MTAATGGSSPARSDLGRIQAAVERAAALEKRWVNDVEVTAPLVNFNAPDFGDFGATYTVSAPKQATSYSGAQVMSLTTGNRYA